MVNGGRGGRARSAEEQQAIYILKQKRARFGVRPLTAEEDASLVVTSDDIAELQKKKKWRRRISWEHTTHKDQDALCVDELKKFIKQKLSQLTLPPGVRAGLRNVTVVQLRYSEVIEALLWCCGRFFGPACHGGPATAADMLRVMAPPGSAIHMALIAALKKASCDAGGSNFDGKRWSHVHFPAAAGRMLDGPGGELICTCSACRLLDLGVSPGAGCADGAQLREQLAVMRPHYAAAAWELLLDYVSWFRARRATADAAATDRAIEEDAAAVTAAAMSAASSGGSLFHPDYVAHQNRLATQELAECGTCTCDVCNRRVGLRLYSLDARQVCVRHKRCLGANAAAPQPQYVSLLTGSEMAALMVAATVNPAHAHQLLEPGAVWEAARDTLPLLCPASEELSAQGRAGTLVAAAAESASSSGIVAGRPGTCTVASAPPETLGVDGKTTLLLPPLVGPDPSFVVRRLAAGVPCLVDMHSLLPSSITLADMLTAAGDKVTRDPCVETTDATLENRFGAAKAAEIRAAAAAAAVDVAAEPDAAAEQKPTHYSVTAAKDQYTDKTKAPARPLGPLLHLISALIREEATVESIWECLYKPPTKPTREPPAELRRELEAVLSGGRLAGPLPHGVKVVNFPNSYELDRVVGELIRVIQAAVASALPGLLGPGANLVDFEALGFYDPTKMYLSLGLAVTDPHVDDTCAWNVTVWAALPPGADPRATTVATWMFVHASHTAKVHALLTRLKLDREARDATKKGLANKGAFTFRADVSLYPADLARLCRDNGVPVAFVQQRVGDRVDVPANAMHVVWTHYPALKFAADYTPAFCLHPCLLLTDAVGQAEARLRCKEESGRMVLDEAKFKERFDGGFGGHNSDRAGPEVMLEFFLRHNEPGITAALQKGGLRVHVDWALVLQWTEHVKDQVLTDPLHAPSRHKVSGAAPRKAAGRASARVTRRRQGDHGGQGDQGDKGGNRVEDAAMLYGPYTAPKYIRPPPVMLVRL